MAVEKRRRRRESHNAVERRRRDNINERIAELATLIPEVMLDPHGTFSLLFHIPVVAYLSLTQLRLLRVLETTSCLASPVSAGCLTRSELRG